MTQPPAPPSITVRALVEDRSLHLTLELLAGHAGLDRVVDHPRIQKSGLAFVGHFHGVVPSRIQIIGETEASFLHTLEPEQRRQAIRGVFSLGLSFVIITSSERDLLDMLREEADRASVPLAASRERSSRAIAALHALLDERLAPRTTLHGVLVDVFGQGLLLLGDSGIGKSECALELVMRGHRLVADDAVLCDWRPPGLVFGSPPDVLRHHIEVRGLGVLNVNHLFGITSVRTRKRIDLVIRLVVWSRETEYDRMGVDDHYTEILGVPLREVVLPVQPGRSTASIIEIAARNEMVRSVGVHSARDFFARLDRSIAGDGDDSSEFAASDRFAEPDVETPRPQGSSYRTTAPESIERDRDSGSVVERANLPDRVEAEVPAPSVRLAAAVTSALQGELGE